MKSTYLTAAVSSRRGDATISSAVEASFNLVLTVPRSSVTGLLLAGVGHVTEPPDAQRNFLVVDHKTETSQIENAFTRFTKERKDIGIILINQHVCFPLLLTISTYTSISRALLGTLVVQQWNSLQRMTRSETVALNTC
jgi:V-type H+-transporting ATPase subunit F